MLLFIKSYIENLIEEIDKRPAFYDNFECIV
jgi:hypothetical protein